MTIIAKLGSLLGLSFISGINLYATVAVTGLVTKYHLVQGLPPEFQALNNDLIITVAIILYACEFLADKIPGFDTAWDALHTIIRPFGGALLALMTVGNASPAAEILAFMLGATMATGAHLTKAGVRVLINTSPEPFSNIAVSLAEDVGVVSLAYLSLSHPVLALIVTVILTIIIIILLPFLWRAIKMLLSGVWHRVINLGKSAGTLSKSSLPLKIVSYLDENDIAMDDESVVFPAWTTKIRGFKRWQRGYLIKHGRKFLFLPNRLFKREHIALEINDQKDLILSRGFLFNKVLIKGEGERWNIIIPRAYEENLKNT